MTDLEVAGPAPRQGTFRQRHRERRRREFLDAALAVVISDGLPALTMQRVTSEVGCAVGSIYQYFGSKGALIAALQTDAVHTIGDGLVAALVNVDRRLAASNADPAFASLARLVTAAEFWVAAEHGLPREIEMCRRMLIEPAEILSDDEATPVLPSAIGLLDLACAMFQDAESHGMLRPADNLQRAVALVGGATGVQLTASLRRWDDRLGGDHFVSVMVTDLLRAWATDEEQLGRAIELAAALAADGELIAAPAGTTPGAPADGERTAATGGPDPTPSAVVVPSAPVRSMDPTGGPD